MKKAVFISDTHLNGENINVQDKIINFFQKLLTGISSCRANDKNLDGIDGVVILGDFFDFWFSRGERIYEAYMPVVETMKKLKQKGIQIIICEGNHDFFLKDYFSTRLGFQVNEEWLEIEMGGLRTLASHGDTVDRTDLGYRALRCLLRSHFAFKIQQILPLDVLWKMAIFFSKLSNKSSNKRRLLDTMYKFSLEKFKEGYDVVILGHCHYPMFRELEQSGRRKVFATLGDWERECYYLLYNDGEFSLQRFGS